MLVDARNLTDRSSVQADLCIVGSGAAAIPLALELGDTPLRVVLLESGGQIPESGGQGIYQVVAGSPPRLSIDTSRTRTLGGNTNYWGGNCRPLDAADFEPRAWIPHSGWPIHKRQLLPYYERAQAICGLGDSRWYDVDACREHLRHLPVDVAPLALTDKVLHTCPQPSFADLHRDRLETVENVRVYLHTGALRLRTNATGHQVYAVEASGPTGHRLHIEASMFVLAAGAIENARLLLCSTDVHRNGLANEHDLVGRFFMEHWCLDIPLDCSSDAHDLNFYTQHQSVDGTNLWGHLVLSEEFMRSESVPSLALYFRNNHPTHAGVGSPVDLLPTPGKPPWQEDPLTEFRLAMLDPGNAARRVLSKLNLRSGPPDSHRLRVELEQTPNPENRVRLSTERDSLGQPKAEIILRLSAAEKQAHARSLELAGNQLSLNGRRLARQMSLMLGAGRFHFFWHHMGSTRMHPDPAQGVVDADCRAHGVSNLFVAGSSVFPTSGIAPPTLTIVALALRLADHIRLICGHSARRSTDADVLPAAPMRVQ